MSSYPRNRKQHAQIQAHTSRWFCLRKGIPQWFISGSTVFKFFVNDLLCCIQGGRGSAHSPPYTPILHFFPLLFLPTALICWTAPPPHENPGSCPDLCLLFIEELLANYADDNSLILMYVFNFHMSLLLPMVTLSFEANIYCF